MAGHQATACAGSKCGGGAPLTIERLHGAAEDLTEIAALILAEADRMAAVTKRFSERRDDKRERRARE